MQDEYSSALFINSDSSMLIINECCVHVLAVVRSGYSQFRVSF